jgi:D-alanyl-D-alanine carboxypeptidase (penicillin-binding protein 5/6)
MNDQEPNIIEDETPSTKNSFPILAQLGILGFVFIIIFGSWITQKSFEVVDLPPPTAKIDLDNRQYPITPQKIEQVSVVAQAAHVWDVKGQRALYTKNANASMPLASITKLMTALLAHELISEKQTATVPLSAIKQEGSSGLSVGERIDIEDLRELALVSSSNDAAYALAASVGELLGDKDPASQFIRGMNIRAEELGFSSLEFKNTTGLDLSPSEAGAIGTAQDVSLLMEYIITEYPGIIEPTQQAATRIYNTAGAYHEADNTNQAVKQIPNLIGSKTGYTDLAGGNLTVAFDAGLNRPIIITVLGSTRDGRFTDILNLIDATQISLSEK